MEVNQGYTIIQKQRAGNKEFALGHNSNAPNPYVTWKCSVNQSDYYWGHYFNDKDKALKDFNKRVREEKAYER